MSRENRLELVKQSLGLLVEMLRERLDRHRRLRHRRPRRPRADAGPRQRGDPERGRGLQPGGSTNAAAGLELATMARGSFVRAASTASSSPRRRRKRRPDRRRYDLGQIRDGTETGIQLVAIGVGMGNFNDVLLERLADDGDGFTPTSTTSTRPAASSSPT
jgi:Ca-activated chloride channel family protein